MSPVFRALFNSREHVSMSQVVIEKLMTRPSTFAEAKNQFDADHATTTVAKCIAPVNGKTCDTASTHISILSLNYETSDRRKRQYS